MGTRHFQKVISKEGEVILAQYGQWDGYPSGQGVDILEFLRDVDLDEYEEKLKSIRVISSEEIDALDDNWGEKYPYLSRDCGAKIHQMVMDNRVQFKSMCSQEEADKWCEGFYTIDLQKRLFIVEFHGVKMEIGINPIDMPRTNNEFLSMFMVEQLKQDEDMVEDLEDEVPSATIKDGVLSINIEDLPKLIKFTLP